MVAGGLQATAVVRSLSPAVCVLFICSAWELRDGAGLVAFVPDGDQPVEHC